jgi:DNA (cytosine-5)-methyltransferase 1|tara:strand:- start:889 stop:2010 length:1122 start_codon:yes stop_codon:yes gene_type:complete
MNYFSICSGIECASVAWHPLGFEPLGFCEIEPFRSAVLNYHYPEVKNYGDFTKIGKKDIGGKTPTILVGGTPCATFSVAGLREGIKSDRGNLALEFILLIKRLNPKWFVWENVPGVLSSNGGKDFASFLGGLASIGYGFSYRVLDTQHIRTQRFPRAIPQMRRRVFVVGHFRDWRRSAEVLFDREILSWNPPPSRTKKEKVTRETIHRRIRSDQYVEDDIAGTIAARDYKSSTDLIAVASGHTKSNGTGFKDDGGMFTLTSSDHHSVLCFETSTPDGFARMRKEEVSPTLNGMTGGNRQPCVVRQSKIRRLTPVECERLQGLPDNYTQVPYRGKPKEEAPISKRYEACGRGMSVNVMEFLGTNIKKVEEKYDQ